MSYDTISYSFHRNDQSWVTEPLNKWWY